MLRYLEVLLAVVVDHARGCQERRRAAQRVEDQDVDQPDHCDLLLQQATPGQAERADRADFDVGVLGAGPISVATLVISRANSDPRVDKRVQDVDRHARQQTKRGADDHDGHDHVVVAAADALEGEPACPGYACQRLDEERALDEADEREAR